MPYLIMQRKQGTGEVVQYLNDDGTQLESWTRVGVESGEATTVGNPASSYFVDAGAYMYRDTGITNWAGVTINFDVLNSTDSPNALSNFFFGCDSTGTGLMLRIESRQPPFAPAYDSKLVASAGFDYVTDFPNATSLATFVGKRVTRGVWTAMEISIDNSLIATITAGGDVWGTVDVSSYLQGGYIGLHSDSPSIDICTSYWDNFIIG